MSSSMSIEASIYGDRPRSAALGHHPKAIGTHRRCQVKHGLASDKSLLVIILDLDVDYVHWLVKFPAFCQEICSRVPAIEHKRHEPGWCSVPSQTASKHRSSQVMTISATCLLSCHRSGACFMRRFRSSMERIPLAVYLAAFL
jgi:hypothetical protein